MTTSLTVCFWVILLWALFYLYYWHVFRPVVLVRVRYKIFAARDRLRDLVIAGEITEDNHVFRLLEHRCRHALNVVSWANLLDLNPHLMDEEARLKAQRDFELIKQSNAALRDVYKAIVDSIMGGLILNSPGLWPFILVGGMMIACFYWFNRVKNLVADSFMNAWGLTYLDKELESVAGCRA